MGGLLRPGQAAGPDDPPAQPDQVQLAGHRRCPPRLYQLRRVAERVAVDPRTAHHALSSAERRLGKECVRTCRSPCPPSPQNKTHTPNSTSTPPLSTTHLPLPT